MSCWTGHPVQAYPVPYHTTPPRGQVSLPVSGVAGRTGATQTLALSKVKSGSCPWKYSLHVAAGQATATACLHQGILSLVALPEPVCQQGSLRQLAP